MLLLCQWVVSFFCSLGSQHDGAGNECTGTNQYVMASAPAELSDSNFKHPLKFSQCSIRYFREHLSKLTRPVASTTPKSLKWTLKAKALQSLYNNMVKNMEILRAGKWKGKRCVLKFMLKCRKCRWWRHFWRKTVPGVCRRNTKRSVANCSETCLVRQDPLTTQNANVVDLEDRRRAVDSVRYAHSRPWTMTTVGGTVRERAQTQIPLGP